MTNEAHHSENDEVRRAFIDRARDTHLKFGFYTIALAFTTTAASVQTVKPKDISHGVLVLEVVAWCLLVMSGLTGLLWVFFAIRDYYALGGVRRRHPGVVCLARCAQYGHLIFLGLGMLILVLTRAIAAFAVT